MESSRCTCDPCVTNQNINRNFCVRDDFGDIVGRFHRDHGTEILLDSRPQRIEGRNGHVSAAITSSGATLLCDLVVVSIGIIPNDALASHAGIATDDGILVNEYGETNQPKFYAAGDVTNHFNPILGRRLRLESWQNAKNQAIAVAKAMCGERLPYADIPWFWSDQFVLNIQMLGAPLQWDSLCFRGDRAGLKFSAFYLQEHKIVGAAAFNKGGDISAARQLISRDVTVDAERLADSATDLRKLARSG